VRISRVVENPKLLWPQTFFVTFQTLLPTTRRQRSVCQPGIVMLLESLQQNVAHKGIE